MTSYPVPVPNSIFMTPILQTKPHPTPLFVQLMQKKILLKGRILKHKKPVKKTIQHPQDLLQEPKKTLHQLSTTITASKRLWKSRLNNSYAKGEKEKEKRLRSRLDCISENESDILSILHLKCSSVFTKKDAMRERERERESMGKEVKSQILTKMTTAHSQEIMKQPYDQEYKQAVHNMLGQDRPIIYRKKTLRSLSRQSVELTSKDPTCMRNSLNPSPKKTSSTTTKTESKQKPSPNKPLLRYDPEELQHIKAESFCVVESTGRMVLNFRGNLSCQIASLTKLMTAYLVLRICKDLGIDPGVEKVEVQEYVEEVTGTSAELIHGDVYSVEELLYGLLLPSGNDAALVLADWGGLKINKNPKKVEWRDNVARFVQEMTRYSHKLGMKSTRYGNPHGLPHPEALSTASDQCKLASLCLQLPLLATIFSTLKYKFTITNTDHRKRDIFWQNTNKLLRRQGFIGIKTGITVTAGPCLITAYKFKDKTYIAAVLRSNKVSRRFKDSRKILYWVLSKLYSGSTCFEETLQLEKLRKNNRDLDSDNSEDEQEFRYGKVGAKEYSRRNKILINDL